MATLEAGKVNIWESQEENCVQLARQKWGWYLVGCAQYLSLLCQEQIEIVEGILEFINFLTEV